ncbi:MAG: hypothetical protein Q9180_009954, partial [Flavoplaca navasiana]
MLKCAPLRDYPPQRCKRARALCLKNRNLGPELLPNPVPQLDCQQGVNTIALNPLVDIGILSRLWDIWHCLRQLVHYSSDYHRRSVSKRSGRGELDARVSSVVFGS